MILIACAQAVLAVMIGALLVQRGRRGWGLVLIGIGASILVVVLVALFAGVR
jgi:hypothetical protein